MICPWLDILPYVRLRKCSDFSLNSYLFGVSVSSLALMMQSRFMVIMPVGPGLASDGPGLEPLMGSL